MPIFELLQYIDLRADFADEYRKAWALCYPGIDESVLGQFSIEELVANAKKGSAAPANGLNSVAVESESSAAAPIEMKMDVDDPSSASATRMIPQSNY